MQTSPQSRSWAQDGVGLCFISLQPAIILIQPLIILFCGSNMLGALLETVQPTLTLRPIWAMNTLQSMEASSISKPLRVTGMFSKLAMSKAQDRARCSLAHRGRAVRSPRKLQGKVSGGQLTPEPV